MNKRILILGSHPLVESLVQQYKALGYMVDCRQDIVINEVTINDYDELCLLTSNVEKGAESSITNDHRAVAILGQLAVGYDVELHGGRKLVCHLLLQSGEVLRMLLETDFCEEIRKRVEVYPFTMNKVWSQRVVLDYEPITAQSEKHAHLVIFGMGEMAEMVAIQAALTAHFPNYIHNHFLRTRITLIDEAAEQKGVEFRKRYQQLFDNSFYREVILSNGSSEPIGRAVTLFHHPMYEGQREDFVDVEWEFVAASVGNAEVRSKLQLWGKDECQLLTVVMADSDENKNLSEALCLPDLIYRNKIPIYILYSQQVLALTRFPNVHYLGLHDKGYDVTLPLIRMAKNVNYVYDRCFEDNIVNGNVGDMEGRFRYSVEIDREERERSWSRLSNVKRMSNIYNAMTIASKMRSVGLDKDDWEQFYDILQRDIELLAQVEHNRWNVEELILGYRPCTNEELRYVEEDVQTRKNELKQRKIHYDLRAYSELQPDGTGKSVKVYDRCLCSCLPLIAKAYADEEKESFDNRI